MAQVFRDQCREAYRRGGLKKVVWLWFPTFFDLTKTALAEHIWEVFHMFKMKKITVPELLSVLSPLLVFLTLFVVNPAYMGALFVLETPYLITPFVPWGWIIVLTVVGSMLAARYLYGVAHGITIQFRNDVVRLLSFLILLLAHFLVLLGPAALAAIRAI